MRHSSLVCLWNSLSYYRPTKFITGAQRCYFLTSIGWICCGFVANPQEVEQMEFEHIIMVNGSLLPTMVISRLIYLLTYGQKGVMSPTRVLSSLLLFPISLLSSPPFSFPGRSWVDIAILSILQRFEQFEYSVLWSTVIVRQ